MPNIERRSCGGAKNRNGSLIAGRGRANKLFDQAHDQFKVLREAREGRAGITALVNDPNPYVASTAAAYSLLWEPQAAEVILESLERSADVPWQVRISAEYTLKEWRAGRLSFDW